MTLLVMVTMAMNSYAQYYYDDYATQVMINCDQRWNHILEMARWQHQNAMYQAAQQVQWQMRNSWSNWQQTTNISVPIFSASSSYNSYNSEEPAQSTSRMRTRDARCTNCLGRGFNPKTVYMGSNQYRTVQDRCNFCHGTGTVTEAYYE